MITIEPLTLSNQNNFKLTARIFQVNSIASVRYNFEVVASNKPIFTFLLFDILTNLE